MARSNERMLSELVKTTAEEVTRRKDAAEQVSCYQIKFGVLPHLFLFIKFTLPIY